MAAHRRNAAVLSRRQVASWRCSPRLANRYIGNTRISPRDTRPWDANIAAATRAESPTPGIPTAAAAKRASDIAILVVLGAMAGLSSRIASLSD